MAFIDNRALRGRPSLRRALNSLDNDQAEAFTASVSDLDPQRWRGLYKQRAEQFLTQEHELQGLRNRDLVAQREEEAKQLRRNRDFPMNGGGFSAQPMNLRGLSRRGYDDGY